MVVTFNADTELEGGLVAHLGGTVDVTGAEEIWESVSREVGDRPARILFDFSDVSILTSAGIGVLVRLLTRLKSQGGSLAIYGCDAKVREIFNIVMLSDILQVCDDLAAAREKLKP